jgi:hypothetical protein
MKQRAVRNTGHHQSLCFGQNQSEPFIEGYNMYLKNYTTMIKTGLLQFLDTLYYSIDKFRTTMLHNLKTIVYYSNLGRSRTLPERLVR